MAHNGIFLVVDMGGTSCQFGLFGIDDNLSFTLLREKVFVTADYASFTDLLEAVKRSDEIFVDGISFVVLAPPAVVDGEVCYPPNIPWSVDVNDVRKSLGIEQTLMLNDYMAQGFACMVAGDKNLREQLRIKTVWEGHGQPVPTSPLAVIGAGTGCGKAVVYPWAKVVLPSEGGHAMFPFASEEEWAFAQFLKQRLCTEFVTGDDVLGGAGLAMLYSFHSGKDLLPLQVSEQFAAGGQRTPEMERTLEWYARFLGRFCRNFILDIMPRNGLFITGGVPAYTRVLEHPAFLSTVHFSPTQNVLLKKIPIYHVGSNKVGIMGGACFAALVLAAQREQEQLRKKQQAAQSQ